MHTPDILMLTSHYVLITDIVMSANSVVVTAHKFKRVDVISMHRSENQSRQNRNYATDPNRLYRIQPDVPQLTESRINLQTPHN